MTEPVRLQVPRQRWSGIAPRRGVDTGRPGEQNGEVVRELGTRVIPGEDQVQVDGRSVVPVNAVLIALHKPAGYLTSSRRSAGPPHDL